MSKQGFSNAGELLTALLDRQERSPNATRISARIDIDGFRSISDRDAFEDEIAALVKAGGVRLIQTGPRSERTTTGIALADRDVVYAYLGRKASSLTSSEALSHVRQDHRMSPAALELLDRLAEAWARGVSHVGISPGDVLTLEKVLGLAAALGSRQADAGLTDYRTFSRVSVGDSKALERNLRPLAQVLAQLHPGEFRAEGRPFEEVLAEQGITRLPQPLLLGGRLTLSGQCFPAMPYVGIPAEMVGAIRLVDRPSYVLTIENFTSFVRFVREVHASDAVVIYSGGFPSNPVMAAILSIAATAQAPTFHWGDMDWGGVRIFRHLELRLAEVGVKLLPHMMSPALLAERGSPMDEAVGGAADFTDSAVNELSELIRSAGLVHEQEDLDPVSPM